MKCRKFSIYRLIDELFWLLVGIMPWVLYFVYVQNVETPMTFDVFMTSNLGIVLSSDSVIYSAFERLFVNGFGFFDIFESMGTALQFCVWFFFVQFLHVTFDIVAFLPKLFHEFMHGFCYKDRE